MALTSRDHYNQAVADSSDVLWNWVLDYEQMAAQERKHADGKPRDSFERRVALQKHAELRMKAELLRGMMKHVQALKK